MVGFYLDILTSFTKNSLCLEQIPSWKIVQFIKLALGPICTVTISMLHLQLHVPTGFGANLKNQTIFQLIECWNSICIRLLYVFGMRIKTIGQEFCGKKMFWPRIAFSKDYCCLHHTNSLFAIFAQFWKITLRWLINHRILLRNNLFRVL